jgi:hypothetical protein
MCKGAVAYISADDELSNDRHIRKLRLLGTHGEALSISM